MNLGFQTMNLGFLKNTNLHSWRGLCPSLLRANHNQLDLFYPCYEATSIHTHDKPSLFQDSVTELGLKENDWSYSNQWVHNQMECNIMSPIPGPALCVLDLTG